MPMQVVNGAKLECTFGDAPSTFGVLPVNNVKCGNQPAANIMDYMPVVNIKPFGMCKAPTNPTVVTATTAAAGVLTPQTCIPATVAPWAPGAATVMIGFLPALDDVSICNCTWLGVISITDPGQTTTQIP